jgi:aminopeptidase N
MSLPIRTVSRACAPDVSLGVERWSPRSIALRLLALLLCAAVIFPAPAQEPAASGAGLDVERYTLRLQPDIDTGSFSGDQRILARVLADGLSTAVFDAGDLVVRSMYRDGAAVAFEREGRQLRIRLPSPARAGQRLDLRIVYDGKPTHGLQFHPARRELYTIFSTSQWMICVDAPSERAAFDLELILPRDLRVAANGIAEPVRDLEDGLSAHRWRQAEPISSFLYGFAAAPYQEAQERVGRVRLRYLSIDQDSQRLMRTFADTRDMLRFFERRAGFAYRGDYAQALVASTFGQEMAGLAVLSEDYGAKVLDDAQNSALLAHELAHQWWGVAVTCRDWGHFWLNEGVANFMAAAWLEHRFGEAAYRAQVAGWEHRLDRLRADQADHPLIYERWQRPTANDRAVVYQKGAYVLHRLRLHLGERAFWRGIRAYTRTHRGGSVTTADFRSAMERASGRDLAEFFAEWVEGPAPMQSAAGG